MDLAALKLALKRFGFDDSDPLTTWLNAAMREIENEEDWAFLEAETDIAALAGASSLTLPPDFFKVYSLTDTTNKFPVARRDSRWVRRHIETLTETGKAEIFWLIGLNTLKVWRVLDSAATFHLIYVKQLSALVNDADVPGIPDRFHYTIVRVAAVIGLQAENEEERATTQQLAVERDLGAMRLAYSYRDLTEAEQVVDEQEYGG